MTSYTINEYPKELQKKVTLLTHFRGYLDAAQKDLPPDQPTQKTAGPPVYVKKWMRTRHAIMFRLSNKIV